MNRIKEISANEVEMYVFGDIGYDWWYSGTENSAASFLRDFFYCEAKYDNITIKINSLGGIVSEGLPMVNAIRQSKKNVKTINTGVAMSMGAVLLMSAKEVVCANNSITMFHSPVTGVYGNAADLRKEADVLDVFNDALAASIALKCKKDKAEILSTLLNCEDHFLSAQDMLDGGYCNSLLDIDLELPEDVNDINVSNIAARLQDVSQCYRAVFNKAPSTLSKLKSKFIGQISNSKNKTEMDLKILAKSIGMDENSSEEAINAHIATLKIKAEAHDQSQADAKKKEDSEKKIENQSTVQLSSETIELIVDKTRTSIMAELKKDSVDPIKISASGEPSPDEKKEETIEDIYAASRKRIENLRKKGE